MGPLTIIYLLHNFPNSNSRIIRFFFGDSFSFELDKFDYITYLLYVTSSTEEKCDTGDFLVVAYVNKRPS